MGRVGQVWKPAISRAAKRVHASIVERSPDRRERSSAASDPMPHLPHASRRARSTSAMNRREFLSLSAAALVAPRAPAIVIQDGDRPGMPCGVATGDVTDGQAIVWSRSDRPARLIVEYSTTPSFADTRRVVGPAALEATDFTARVDLVDLPPGQRISYRAQFQDLSDLRRFSEPVLGKLPDAGADCRAGRGGRGGTASAAATCRSCSPATASGRAGASTCRAAACGSTRRCGKLQPDVFIHLGDTIYADQPLKPEVTLDDGSIWRNLVTEAKSRPAQTLDDFRGCHRYNLQDEHMRRFNAEVSQVALWDDHEVRDNWYPTQRLAADARVGREERRAAGGAREARVPRVPAAAHQPDRERTDLPRLAPRPGARDLRARHALVSRRELGQPADDARARRPAILGDAQVAWLERALAASTATWKVIACRHAAGPGRARCGRPASRRWPTATPARRSAASSRSRGLLKFIKDRAIRNVVWITADVHYCAAHHYRPSARRLHRVRSVLGVRRRAAARRHLRPERAGRDVRPGGEVPRHPAGDEAEPAAERAASSSSAAAASMRRTGALTMKLHNVNGEIYSVELPAAR